MLRTLIFGAHGQLGRAVSETAPPDAVAIPHASGTTDIRDTEAVRRALVVCKPDVVINCAAYTRVDDAESFSDEAIQVNGMAPGYIAAECRRLGARFLHVSTDYVFDGSGGAPYETNAATAPINKYGISKLEGEHRAFEANPDIAIVRTAWLHSAHGRNFVTTAARLLSGGTTMKVVDDQVGTPTNARNLANVLWLLAKAPNLTGLYHFTDAGVASWYDVATAVRDAAEQLGRLPEGVTVEPVGSGFFPTPAKRPSLSILSKRSTWSALDYRPIHWREGVLQSTRDYLAQNPSKLPDV